MQITVGATAGKPVTINPPAGDNPGGYDVHIQNPTGNPDVLFHFGIDDASGIEASDTGAVMAAEDSITLPCFSSIYLYSDTECEVTYIWIPVRR